MAVKKKRIQVPESIAQEVKLFAKLLELGEITSVYDLLREIDSRVEGNDEEEYLSWSDLGSLEILWSAVVSEIYGAKDIEDRGINDCLTRLINHHD